MPRVGGTRSLEGMAERNVLDRVEAWLRATITHENFVNRRPVIEIVAAAVWFVLPLPHVANWGGALGIISHLLLAATLVAYRLQPIVALTLGAVGTLGILGSGFLWATNYWWIFLPLLAVFFGVAAYGRPPTRWLGLAGAPVAALGIVAGIGSYYLAAGILFFLFLLAVFALAWVGGMLVG